MLAVYGLSEATSDPKKKGSNEDRLACVFSSHTAIVAVADGVTQPLDAQGRYPVGRSGRGAEIFVNTAVATLNGSPFESGRVTRVFSDSNWKIEELNKKENTFHLDNWITSDRIATTAAMVWLEEKDDGSMSGFVASIGDAVILAIIEDQISVLSRDQLHACHKYSYRHFAAAQGESQEVAGARRSAWQRQHVRNNPEALNPETHQEIGFGVLDGNKRALEFLDIRRVEFPRKTKFVVASDAIRVLGERENPDNPENYREIAIFLHANSVHELPARIIKTIRETEHTKGARSDDATVAVVVGS